MTEVIYYLDPNTNLMSRLAVHKLQNNVPGGGLGSSHLSIIVGEVVLDVDPSARYLLNLSQQGSVSRDDQVPLGKVFQFRIGISST